MSDLDVAAAILAAAQIEAAHSHTHYDPTSAAALWRRTRDALVEARGEPDEDEPPPVIAPGRNY